MTAASANAVALSVAFRRKRNPPRRAHDAAGIPPVSYTHLDVYKRQVLKNGLMTVGLQQQWQVFFTGIAVLLAVLLDIYKTSKDGRTKG